MERLTKTKLYPDSGVELDPFTARNYDRIMNTLSLGLYRRFIRNAIAGMSIKPYDKILDLGCGTGRNATLMLQYLGTEGKITGIDLSPIMQKQFEKRFAGEQRVSFIKQRIDLAFDLNEKFDVVFISFVIHGFPYEARQTIIENANRHLKQGGKFIILDFAELDMDKMPPLHRLVFKKIECPYAFDYIKRNWKQILSGYGFTTESEAFYLKKYVRLLKTKKG